jgi:hypothetical protein
MAVLEREKITVYKSNAYPSRNFSMDQTPEAFMALSSLYSNRVRAVIREISTNARDAMIEAGNADRKFFVTLPDIAEQIFKVRDFGIGLAIKIVTGDIVYNQSGDAVDETETIFKGSYAEVEEYLNMLLDEGSEIKQVESEGDSYWLIDGVKHRIADEAMELYTTYFRSTKRDTNEQTGQLGLGSKSPFCYTDTFQVRCFYHGEMRQYSLNINDDGIPEVNLIDALTCETDEEDGVEVSMDVKSGDIWTFHRNAKVIYRDFDNRPTMMKDDLDYEEYDKFLEGDDWFLAHNLSQAHIRMGNVCYPLDNNVAGIKEVNRKILDMKIMVDCPIGSFDVVPSREAAKYTQKTVAYLDARLDQIREAAEKQIMDTLKDSESLWEARCWAATMLFDRQSELANLAKMCKLDNLTWNGHKLGHAEIEVDYECIRFIRIQNYSGRGYHKTKEGWKAQKSDTTMVKPAKNTLFVIDDLPRGAQSRVRHLIKSQPDDEQNCTVDRAYIFRFNSKVQQDIMLAKTGFPADKLTKASDLEKPPYVQRTNTGFRWSSNAQVFVHRGKAFARRLHEYWEAEQKDLNNGGIYVEMCRYKAREGHHEREPGEIGKILVAMARLNLPVPEVVGVRPATAKHFRKSDKWIDFWSYVTNLVRMEVINRDIAKKLAHHKIATRHSPDHDETWTLLSKRFKAKYQDSMFGDFAKTWQETWHYESFDENDTWNSLCRMVKVSLDVDDLEVPNIKEEISKINLIYPMLHAIMDCRWHDIKERHVATIIDYIHMIDQLRNPNVVVEDDVPF